MVALCSKSSLPRKSRTPEGAEGDWHYLAGAGNASHPLYAGPGVIPMLMCLPHCVQHSHFGTIVYTSNDKPQAKE